MKVATAISVILQLVESLLATKMSVIFDKVNCQLVRENIVANGPLYSLNDDIVISGISGRLPESSNIEEFKKQLFEGVDLVTEDDRRWPAGHHGLPSRSGKLKDLASFDATFFGVHAKQATVMDPQQRMLLELTYEAILDAGINPEEIKGTKTGVFVGVSTNESSEFWTKNPDTINGYGLTGCGLAMFANRLSYTFDFSGPSFALDTACSSSLYALHHAVIAMRTGKCDAAIVGGVNLLLKPTLSIQLQRLNMLSRDGTCKVFDALGDGYVRSEAAVVVYLQKSRDARRVYATIINSGVNADGFKEQGFSYPSSSMQSRLMHEVYTEVGVNPADVVYVEAHGTGTKVGDPQEVNAIAEVFCKDRKLNNSSIANPLLLGSVKSNMGHTEPASGLCSIIKVLLAMEQGIIPPNLHFTKPNTEIPALFNGSIKVVTKPTPWKGGFVGVNSWGVGGANAHVLLRSNPKPKVLPVFEGSLPKMVVCSGRTEEAVKYLINEAQSNKKDHEFASLLHSIYSGTIAGHSYRGYHILGEPFEHTIELVDNTANRPVWYVFSGIGQQWAGMGKELLSIPSFVDSLQRCAEALKPLDFDLIDLIDNQNDETYDDVLNSFVGIAALQVALVDLLTLLGIQPDGMIGLSTGEMGCAYADGAMTAEQTVLSAYWRGRSIKESSLQSNVGMAVLGLSWAETKKRCSTDIFPAVHTYADLVTVSGPVPSLEKLITELKAEGIFTKTLKSSGFAFHSKYIDDAGPRLQASLEKIIPNPKKRTKRWISTSIPEHEWNMPLAQYSSAAYFVNNLLSPVTFFQALVHVPENAIVIEVGPHCELQSILKRALPVTVTNVGLQKKKHTNKLFLLNNLGKLYNAGVQLQINKLYPSISYPVGRGTPMISPLIKWDHSIKWDVADFSGKSEHFGETVVEVDLSKESDAYLAGHCIDGKVLFPASGFITLIWDTFAKLCNTTPEKLSVVLEDLNFHRATILPKEGPVKFLINILDGTGEFVVNEGNSVVVTGKIRAPEEVQKESLCLKPLAISKEQGLLGLKKSDIYKNLRMCGYDFAGLFQSLANAENRATVGKITWSGNWISFIDAILQFNFIGMNKSDLYLPNRIQKIIIDPLSHADLVESLGETEQVLSVYSYSQFEVVKAGGVELRGIKNSLAPRKQQIRAPKYEKYVFVPYKNSQVLVENPEKANIHALCTVLQTARENTGGIKLKVVEVADGKSYESLLAPIVLEILYNQPEITVDYGVVTDSSDIYPTVINQCNINFITKDPQTSAVGKDLNITIATDVISKNKIEILKNLAESLKIGGFVLLMETGALSMDVIRSSGLIYVSKQSVPKKSYVLLKKKEEGFAEPIIVQITEKKFSWLKDAKSALEQSVVKQKKVLFVSQCEETLGIVGLMNCLRKEDGGKNLSYIFIQDENAPKFSLSDPFYAKQLDKQLMANVLKNRNWGNYCHLPLDLQIDVSSLPAEHAYINTLTRGDLSSLRWIEGPLSHYQPNNFINKVFCSVYYASLNFRDIMLATGKLNADALPDNLANEDCILGLEFAGRDPNGRRVMGMVAAQGLATTMLADPGFIWQVPDKWTLEEAATIPVAYATSYYALCVRGNIKQGDSILIHAGSGGVGQASIAIALHMGCTVFTTVGTQDKRDFLKKNFPQLNHRNIGHSRDTSFEKLVLFQTDGRGVDLVLNSLAGDQLQASVRCLARGGRFLEIGKFDLSRNTSLGMSVFLKNVTFHGILLDSFFNTDYSEKKEIVRLVSEGIKSGAVKPLPTTVFNDQQVEQAFRFMATGKHIGKILLKIRDEENAKNAKSTSKFVNSIPRTYMNPEKSYILVGGLGGFGMELANWIINRGAKYIILTSRSGIRTGYQSLWVRRWREAGVNVVISTEDVTNLAGAERLISQANKLAQVGGIFNLAGVLADNLFERLVDNDFRKVALPKVNGTKNLDIASRKLCPMLDYFVCFSSVACGRGALGQANYGMANSAMERICEQRQDFGLPGLAIQWGSIGDVGMVADMIGDNEIELGGTLPQRIPSCLDTIDVFLKQPHPVLSSLVLAEKHKTKEVVSKVGLLEVIANIIGIKDVNTVNPNYSLSDLGLDSLMGTEIKQMLERNYDIMLSLPKIRGLTFTNLKELALFSSKDVKVNHMQSSSLGEKTASRHDGLLFQTLEIVLGEVMPKKSLVRLKTCKTETGLPIFFVSAIDGVIASLERLSSELDLPAWGLQCTKDAPLENIQDFAKFNIEMIMEVQKQGPYTLVGYSFGAMVAFEMALQLESLGEAVNLNLIDGSPEFLIHYNKTFKEQAEHITKSFEENDTKKLIAFFIRRLNSSVSFFEAYSQLRDAKSNEEMFNKMLNLIGLTPFNAEDVKEAAILFVKKVKLSEAYQPGGIYQGPVTLFKAKDNFIPINFDYGLSKICKQNVRVEELNGNHRSILSGQSLKKIAETIRTQRSFLQKKSY